MKKLVNRRGLWELGVVSAMAIVAGALTACGGGGGGGGRYGDPFYHAWYDVYGNRCNTGYPKPGCNFYLDGDKITSNEDPYYTSSVRPSWGSYSYVDSYGFNRTYTGWAWWSPDNILYDDLGHALNQDGEDSSLDAVAQAGSQEEEVLTTVGKDFASKYALSEDAGLSIARTLKDWATLSKKRARTTADIADFTKRLYGVDMTAAVAALAEAQAAQSTVALEGLNTKIATYWNTSPETSRVILKNWYSRELQAAGVK